VSRTIGAGVELDEAVGVVEVGVGVTVTLKVVGITVVNGTLLAPERMRPVEVIELVVSTTEAGMAVEAADVNCVLELCGWPCTKVKADNAASRDDMRIVRGPDRS
jgi:hypothetical protein